MNTLRTKPTLRVGLALAILLSWFAFSNRCALGQFLSSRQADIVQHECCDKKSGNPHQAPAKSEPQECCKTLNAVSGSGAKAPAFDLVVLAAALAFQVAMPVANDQSTVEKAAGPPQAASFAELVLHRSLHSHAPPFCA